MVMNAANGIQGRLRSSAVSWVTVHKPTDQCESDFDGAVERLNANKDQEGPDLPLAFNSAMVRLRRPVFSSSRFSFFTWSILTQRNLARRR